MYHISRDGKERRCNAKTVEACRANPEEHAHFNTREEAREAILKKAAEGQSTITTLTKKSDELNEVKVALEKPYAMEDGPTRRELARELGVEVSAVRIDPEVGVAFVHNEDGSITEWTEERHSAKDGTAPWRKTSVFSSASDLFENFAYEPGENTIAVAFNVESKNVLMAGNSVEGEHEYLAEDMNNYVLDGDKIHVVGGYFPGYIHRPELKETIPANGARSVAEWAQKNRLKYLESKGSSIVQDIKDESPLAGMPWN